MNQSSAPIPVQFKVDDIPCAADLWLPHRAPPVPSVVLANGFSGTKDWILPRFASCFAESGMAALTFDYRHFGRSGGEPRQLVDPARQRADLCAALNYLRARPEVDPTRVALWGTSLGGSHVVNVAADDAGVAAVVCNIPALDAVRGSDVKAKTAAAGVQRGEAMVIVVRLMVAALHDTLRGALGMQPRYLAVYGRPGEAFFTDAALTERFRNVAASSPTWKNSVAARFLLHVPRYRHGTLERIRAPMLFSLATRDLDVSPSFIKKLVAGLPNAQVIEYDAGHFDLYHDPIFERVAADQVSFLVNALGASSGS